MGLEWVFQLKQIRIKPCDSKQLNVVAHDLPHHQRIRGQNLFKARPTSKPGHGCLGLYSVEF